MEADGGPVRAVQSVVWDNHGCMPLDPDDTSFLPQLERYRSSGVDVVSLNVGYDALDPGLAPRVLNTFRAWLSERPEEYVLAQTLDDVVRARKSGKLAVVFDLEGGRALDGRVDMVEQYYDLGVRWMLIAYNRNNRLGGGCQDDDTGLTPFGREVVGEMARVGMVPCLSHTGRRTAFDVLDATDGPVIVSHSNMRSLRDHPRNVDDDLVRAVAETGGVVGINGIGIFLGENDNSTPALVRHIDHAVQLVGPDHVGISLDYVFDMSELDEYVRRHPETFPPELGYAEGIELVEPERMPGIAQSLRELGYEDPHVAKIFGGNWMRVARAVWA